LLELEPRRGIWKRIVLGAFLIVLASSAATAGALFDEVNALVHEFKRGNTLQLDDELAQADPGKPQTILLLGSDTRAKGARDYEGRGARGRSDTMMLVRLDPNQNHIPVLSLPRDLKVQIPGHGVDKLNAAYSLGGVKLTLKTIKNFTGLRVNHVINVDFRGFRKAINALGCVYVDVDRRYFNDNTGGEQYATIDIKPGYQKLCDQDALDYVRYRHTDNDIIRAARQQDFLRQMKAQIGLKKIINDRKELIKIFGKYTQSDIGSRKTVLRLLKLIALSASHPIHQIHFQTDSLSDEQGYVTASSESTHRLADEFLGAATQEEEAATRKKRKRKRAAEVRLIDSSGSGKDQALQLVNQGAKGLDIYYPRQLTPRSQFIGPPRAYTLRGKRNRKYRAYRLVVGYGEIGEYYGIQGMTWKKPPILSGPSEERKTGGRKVRVFYDGERVRLIAWRAHGAAYWVTNTLSQRLNLQQMLAIVRSTKPL
jgi:LCP family protein required for cell wall assembly